MSHEVDWTNFESYSDVDDLLVDWLKNADPYYWHVCAQSINWDWGWRTVGWIVSQRECSLSTVSSIFWNSQPQELIDPKKNQEYISDISSCYFLARLIVDNLRKGYYTDDRFPVWWDKDHQERYDEYGACLTCNPELREYWGIALTLYPRFPTSEMEKLLSDEGFEEGIPLEVLEMAGEWTPPNHTGN